MRKTVTMARYFPRTICPRDTGAVKRSWSVRLFLSSEKLFMVRTGMAISRMNTRELST